MSQRTGSSVIDFSEVRAQKMDEKRRKTERVFFKNLLSVYCVTGHSEMRAIEMVEVSEEGCSFQVPYDAKNPWPSTLNEDLPIRFYFSQDTYILVRMKIMNARPCIDHGNRYVRYGCAVDKTLKSYPAYQQFVRFMKEYSEHAHKDSGDVSVFYI
jgi:hypothetical protein